MKKGFTLVELAIVLVIIGLLMGMAFKGKALVDAARIKVDMNTVQKLSTAISVYYSKYDKLPGNGAVVSGGVTFNDNSSGAIYQTLINEGLLKDSDLKASSGATYWAFTGCNHMDTAWAVAPISEESSLCIYRSSAAPDALVFRSATDKLENVSINGQSICQLETLLDDKSLTAGEGRQAATIGANIVDTDNWNCADTVKNTIANSTTTEYLIRIF